MKIVSLRVDSFQRVKAVEIRPDGNVVRITGNNGEGKSSVLDAIWAALGGKKFVPEVPVHLGEKEAHIEIDLGDLQVTKIIRHRENDEPLEMLVVKGKDGKKYANPQSVLNDLMGALTFDPLQFVKAKPEQRFALLKTFVPDYDFEHADARRKKAYDERTDVNRDLKKVEVQLAAIVVDDSAPTELVDEAALVAELEAAGEKNLESSRASAAYQQKRQAIEQHTANAETRRQEAEELRRQADTKEKLARQEERAVELLNAELQGWPAVPPQIDTTELREQISTARDQNLRIGENIRQRRLRADLRRQVGELGEKSQSLTEDIDAIKGEQRAAIAGSNIPVNGLTLEDDAVLLNGLPFDQASTAQKITASVAIASALNPKLRVIQIRDGSLLDERAMRLIADYAAKHDMQIWVEEVDGTGEVGFYIEDGRLAAADLKAAE
ncbi:MAG: AAA family ATPase [Devosia sp.]|uniref:AAA family ATPase n=1 Tax=Devosia sp. TaxID=1871048 RepID=UPI001AD2E453|nr:AAA family ATPase [Devosia sp.]MBN9317978.1 AAA family ATPase [Devosia sp.]